MFRLRVDPTAQVGPASLPDLVVEAEQVGLAFVGGTCPLAFECPEAVSFPVSYPAWVSEAACPFAMGPSACTDNQADSRAASSGDIQVDSRVEPDIPPENQQEDTRADS